MKTIENWLNGITMYRLVLYYLIILVSLGAVFSLFGWLPFAFIGLVVSALFLICVSRLTNGVFAKVYNAPTNVESAYISALILALIIPPAKNLHELIFLTWAAVFTTASKYILNLNKKHLFNPVAIAVLLTAWGLGESATWWVGTAIMLPFTLVGGWLIVKKIRREDLAYSFLAAALIITPISRWRGTLLESPLLFFASIMLTEPLTTPPTKKLRIIYGLLVGSLFPAQVHLGSIYSTPELALIIGNIFSYLVGFKEKLGLILKTKILLAPNLYEFVFEPVRQFAFIPGQYLEWTLPHNKTDSRGNRRYFTLASAPSEANLRLGVRFNQPSSSFKSALRSLTPGQAIVAGQRAGDFTLPKNSRQKLVFVAGGIGITPFRSMVKFLTDSREKRDIILFYSNKLAEEILYRDIWENAASSIGLKTIYTLTDQGRIPENWNGCRGRIDAALITREIPDYRERLFYLSGPQGLVHGFSDVLTQMGVSQRQIRTDFFPGF